MEGPTARVVGGKKFMWDGRAYEGEKEAAAAAEEYRGQGFEVEIVVAEERHHVFTRRVATDVKVEGVPPV